MSWPNVEHPMVLPEQAETRARELEIIYGPDEPVSRYVLDGIEAGTIVVARIRSERRGVTPGGIAWRG